jgi:hypothetical protein
MAVGQSGKPVKSTPSGTPQAFAGRVGKHVHKGSGEATVGGPGCTSAPGASQQGSSGSSPYGAGGDRA